MSDTQSMPGRTLPVAGTSPASSSGEGDGTAPASVVPGDIVGRYEIRGLLGAGGMGQVFTALDLDLGRAVALKLIRPDRMDSPALARVRLLREAQALAKLQHPNVVAIHDVGTEGDQVFMAMELIDGPTLGAWLDSGTRPWRAIRDVFLAAGRGLVAAHAVGIVHRDFKPSNVIVGANRAVVVDFGIACSRGDEAGRDEIERTAIPTALDVDLTRTGERLGTPRYMAPEQHAGGRVTAQADQFSFAASLWAAFYGAPPFAYQRGAETVQAMNGALAAPTGDREVPERVRAALARALAFRPEDRWPTLADLLDALARDPAARRRRALGVLAIIAVMAPVAFMAGKQTHSPSDPCDGSDRLAAAIWNGPARARAKAAFEATGRPTASTSFDRIDVAMGNRLAALAAAHRDTCEATRVRHEQSETLHDLRMACLARTRGELGAFVEALGRDLDGDGMDRAVSAAAVALDLAPCQDAAELQAAIPPPRDPDAARRVESLGAEVDRLQADFHLGRFKSALGTARTLLPRVRAVGYAPLLARTLLLAGKVENVAGEVEMGIDLLYQAARAAGQARDDAAYARALAALIRPVGIVRGRLDEAARLITLAEGAAERVGRPELLSSLYLQEGIFYDRARRDPIAALARLELALAVDPRHHGLKDVGSGRILNSIANVERSLGRTQAALAHFRQALEIGTAHLGPNHPDVLTVIDNLGLIEDDLGNWEAAGRVFERGLEQSERSFGHGSAAVARVARNLAWTRLFTGRLAEARELADRSVRVSVQVLGENNPETAKAISLAANVSLEQNRIDEALGQARRAVAIVEKSVGSENLGLVPKLLGLSQAELAADHIAEARAAATRAVAIARKSGDPDLAEALMREADVLTRERRYADAVAGYERALELAEKARGPEHPWVMDVLRSAVDALLATGQASRAVTFAERAHRIALTHGPWFLAEAELGLARALAAEGEDRPRAIALARAARARLQGTGYRRSLQKIEAWLADVDRHSQR